MKKMVSALYAVALLGSSSAFADVGDFGEQLQSASARIYEIVSVVENGGTGGDVGGGDVGGGDVGGGTNPWDFEDDKKAVPLYKKSATALGDAGGSFIQAQVLELQKKYQEATLRKTQACARVNIALADLATANHYAAQPGFSMKLKAFGPELSELLLSIRQNRDVYCNF
jgi:hypothetical protein